MNCDPRRHCLAPWSLLSRYRRGLPRSAAATHPHTHTSTLSHALAYPSLNFPHSLHRSPRWGRNQEVPGEDPELTGNYAANFVQGLQGDVGGLDGGHTQITACCKHFIANSLEQWENNTRYDFDAHVTNADLHNYYLPPFRSCVQEGRSRGVMCSYNAVTVDGVFKNIPSCSNDWLLKKTLREGWDFDGYVVRDLRHYYI